MTVYAVWRGDYEDATIEVVFASRELAERYIGIGLREEWEKLYRVAGQVIPRQGYKDGHGGIIPQTEPAPPSFDDWCRGRSGGWIEEYEVLEELPV